MIKHGEVKLGSEVQLVYSGRKGKIIVFDSFRTVGVEWGNGKTEYLVSMEELELSK